nr:hypothetical protein [uncultured Campylobacter sp.]
MAEFQALAQKTATKFLQSDWTAQGFKTKKRLKAEPADKKPSQQKVSR